jgi:hypothetical protein
MYQHDKPNEPTKEGHLSFVFFEFPFTSVSTVSRGHPSLVSRSSTYHSLALKPQKLEKGYRIGHY